MERKLIDYLPIYIQNYAEIKAIMSAEQWSVEKAWVDAEEVMNDQFVTVSGENGIKRWESILNIVPKATHTLDERRFNVLTRLNEQLPYTMESLRNMLSILCGTDGYSLKLDTDRYSLIVKLAIANENNVKVVEDMLNKILPANIVKNVMLFNAHGILGSFTHEQLSTHTHKEVREEIL